MWKGISQVHGPSLPHVSKRLWAKSQENNRAVEKNMVEEVIKFQMIQWLIGHNKDFSNYSVRWEAAGEF